MANLKSLIGAVSPNDVRPLNPGCQMVFFPHCQCYCNSDYSGNCYLYWCMPSGANCAKFEVWAGGGSGGGACCCQQGVPGGSGAYAYKCLKGNTVGSDYSSGDCYQLYPGPSTCCASCCCGILGCKGYISGAGLNNFCVEGGVPGKTCCWIMWGYGYCQGNNCGYYYTEQYCCLCCQPYYGADGGTYGRPSFMWAQCNCGPCYWGLWHHFPGGLVNKNGGHSHVRNMGNACFSDWARCVFDIGWATGESGLTPGVGGQSATSCGGGCCYGYPGNGGFVRVTWNDCC